MADKYTIYKSKDINDFIEDTDAWCALSIGPNMEIALDAQGFIVDIWDADTKKLYDVFGHEIGTRQISFLQYTFVRAKFRRYMYRWFGYVIGRLTKRLY
jgi:hypothetical protein